MYGVLKPAFFGAALLTGMALAAQAQSASASPPGDGVLNSRCNRTPLGQSPAAPRVGSSSVIRRRPIMRRTPHITPIRCMARAHKLTTRRSLARRRRAWRIRPHKETTTVRPDRGRLTPMAIARSGATKQSRPSRPRDDEIATAPSLPRPPGPAFGRPEDRLRPGAPRDDRGVSFMLGGSAPPVGD